MPIIDWSILQGREKKKEEKEQEDSRRANSHKLSNVSFQEAIPEETPD